ncbi:MAG: hypothetical protein N4A45_13595 [Flavobacteriales bacterium]|jgi:hypothetical protein|nr:hypothetical protein [Flavobacteriales bacterium]
MKEHFHIEKVKSSHRKIYSDIIIDQPAEKVWEIISDFKSYKDWAVFMVDIQGACIHQSEITVKFQLDPTKDKTNTISHLIHVEQKKEFYWAEKGPMGICDNHHFIIEEIDEKSARFIQKDELTKGATWLLGGYLSKIYLKGYRAFNKSLKKEVERRFQ